MSTTTTAAPVVTTTATADSSYVPRGPTTASLTFYTPPADNSVPFGYVNEQPAGQPQYNYGRVDHKVSISDIRGAEDPFTLDKDSFQTLQNIHSGNNIRNLRLRRSQVESLLLNSIPGAHKIVLFDHTIRRDRASAHRKPVTLVHVDQTPRAAEDRVRLHVPDPEEAEALLKGRYRIVNVWRPLSVEAGEPVQSSPLAFASAESVDPDDLVPVQLRYPDRTGETMGVKYNAGQKWHYWSGMTGDERLLLKCSDSKGLRDGDVAQWVPHTAFWDERTPAGARPRESIEVRALVFG
ncbi:hypothetical protein N7454_008354 [Penicillium verhagenii]|nr:hypothetical protein N7454_008354 [Penicillium verhagenii]